MSGNKGFQAARRKGAEARRRGEPESSNPYGDLRTDRGSVTFSRAWWRTWREGWLSEDKMNESSAK